MLDRVSKGCQETICQQMVIALTVWPAVARKKLYWFLFLTHNTNIRIRSFCVNSIVGLNVAECIVHPSSTTAIIAKLLWAINEILFTQRYKLSSFLEMLAFKRSRLENKKKNKKQKQSERTLMKIWPIQYVTFYLHLPVNALESERVVGYIKPEF